jgi:signal transduction histidine kinase
MGQGSWSIFNRDNGLGPGIVTSILPTKEGTIWAVHASSEQADVFDGKKWQPVRLPFLLPALDLGDAGGKLIQTDDGVVWLAARYMLFAYRSVEWEKYEQTDIAIPSTRNVIMQTADGALWFVGPDDEIHRVDYQTPRWLTYEDLNFQWESSAGAQWFLHRDGRVIAQDGGRWTSFGVEDDLMDTPVALLGTRRGEIWVAGSHQRIAATARFDGKKWTRYLHEDFSCGIDWRAIFESSDGSVWFGAFVDTDGPEKHRDGILQFRDGVWTHHHQPGRSPHPDEGENLATLLPASSNPDHPIEKFICFGESRDGKIWAGRNILVFYDGKKWQESPPSWKRFEIVETMLTARNADLWIGSRQQGALRYDGGNWQDFQGKGGLVANSIRSLAETTDGTIWAATDRGFSRYDGITWMPDVLPEELNLPHEGGNLKASPSGKLWINRFTREWNLRFWGKARPVSSNADFRTICHQFSGKPPRTVVTAGPAIVAQPGNISILWSGVVSWREPKDSLLQFSFRVDDQPWSPYTSDGGHSFFSLPSGRHHFEVRARDNDFNVDPAPATLDFVVLPPVWRQGWFILLMILLGGLTATQSIRVFLERGRLRRINRALSAEVRERERAEEEVRNLNAGLERHVQERTAQLEAANKELEAFSYSVSHDLRTPLRSIDGFSRALLEDYADKLDAEGKDFLETIRSASQRMGQLIDDMLRLAQIKRSEMHWTEVNLSRMAAQIAGELKKMEPARQAEFIIAPDLVASGDAALLRIMLENVLGNAWKYTSKKPVAKIEFGRNETAKGQTYFVRDNGCGFDMEYVHKLFGAFQRLHEGTEFPGTGVGLASVHRVIQRHGGAVWIEGQVGAGATLYFTLPGKRPNSGKA